MSLLFWLGCDDRDRAQPTPPADTWDDVCIDQDGDGRGFQCADGDDCNDSDPAVFENCKTCSSPSEGCACEPDTKPVDCTVSKQVVQGSLLCKSGTRYCRDSKWSACEGVKTFEAPPPSNLLTRALIDPDAGAPICNACNPDCYRVEDVLSADASYGDSGIVASGSGGITLGSYRTDSGVPAYDAGLLDNCRIGDNDCDGIPDDFNPFPDGGRPFESEHNTIFMDLGPGDTQEESFTIRFFLNTADIYLYLDMTGSMDAERANLIASLRSGNFMPADRVNEGCADRNLNGRTDDEEYLKDAGVAGNLACLIRDSRIGAGWHRDLPLPRPDSQGFAFGPHDFEAFQHEQDITNNVDAVLTGLNRFATRGGINRPEGGIVGLYALATGSQIYLGWNRPGNPARTDCPAGTWGYPCFRDEAVPIIIWMTDAPITNGPAPAENRFENATNEYGQSRAQPVNWETAALRIEAGTGSTYNAVGTTHETFATAYNVGDVNNSFRTFAFDSKSMRNDINYAALVGGSGTAYVPASMVCSSRTYSAWNASTQTAPDAVFKMRVTQNEPITVSTRGSRVQSAIAIVDARRIDGVQATVPTSSNGVPTNPAVFAQPIAIPGSANISGTTASASASFSRETLGCLASGASDKIGATVVKFNLASDAASLRFVTDAAFTASTSLFTSRPGIPSADTPLDTMSFTENAVVKTGNANDVMNTYNLGNMTGAYRRLTGGNTNDTDLTASYANTLFTSAPPGWSRPVPPATTAPTTTTCTGASGTADDQVFDFSLSASTRLRIEGTSLASGAASWDHMIAVVSRGGVVTPVAASNNFMGLDTDTSPPTVIPYASIPSNPYSWAQFSGSSGGAANAFPQYGVGPFLTSTSTTACTNAAAAGSTALQGVFKLVIPTGTSTQSYEFDTGGSAVNTWLSLHQNYADTQDIVPADNTNSLGTALALQPQALGELDEKSVFVTGGSLSSSSTVKVGQTNFGATCAASVNGKDAVYSFTVRSTQTMQVTSGATGGTAPNSGNPQRNGYVGVFAGLPSLLTKVAGGCDDQTTVVNAADGVTNGNSYQTATFTASPGITYYVVVKHFATTGTSATGSYGLWIRDTTHTNHFLACNYGSQPNAGSVHAAKITRSLGPGTYYLVVKTTGTTAGNYTLRVRRSIGATAPTMAACDRNIGGSLHSSIDRTFAAGNYSLIVRGYGSGTAGSYDLLVRDMGYAPEPVACGYDNVDNTTPSSFTASNLAARDGSGNLIDYYLVMRGDTATGNYNMRIEDTSLMSVAQCAFDNVSMTYSQASPYYVETTDINNAEWTGTLPIGEYYVVLKGYDASGNTTSTKGTNDWGMWQFTVGDQANFETSGTFDAKRWLGPTGNGAGGVREALNQRKIRVITVDSTQTTDNAYYSDQQMKTIARATDAVALDGSPLFYKISENGTGLGGAIVTAINTLAGNLAMDVGVRFVEAPDSPAPKHFNFRAEAVDAAGDSCSAPIDTDGDALHLPDTHVRCRPGATPLFKISISNPNPPYNVPTNPNDPNGGWNMRIDLIADGQYVVDQIPVYIIPEDVVLQPGEERYDSQGTYQDTVPSNGCVGNEAPRWGALSWNGSVPLGTSMVWSLCTADTEADLARCTPQTVVAVSASSSCLRTSDCAAGSFCNTDSVCESRVGPRCSGADQASADAMCGSSASAAGTCVGGFCTWRGPVDVKPALPPGSQGKRFARVNVVMNSNATHTRAPTINSWRLDYTCSAQE